MSSIKAFIFDLDGVLTDTAEFHYRSWKQLALEENIPFSREDSEQLRGVTRRESLRRLLKGRAISDAQALDYMRRKNDYFHALLGELSPAYLLPGVAEFLKEASKLSLKLGVGSASRNANPVLTALGIANMFDAIGDGTSVSRTKPAPDIFVWVAGRLGVSPAETVIFEDAESGVEAALASGAYCVGIGPELRVGKADIRLANGLADTSVAQILSDLSRLQT